ncbi:MAG: HAD hydrolase-like protein [Candidatus Latescibacteria bacterium]|jgi:FMN phosphatase YigB (HAD superfamily)|nr:HAD hydrolase-like protein [Candidatus Latescibacterota bacterium]MBT5828658.1 HAD hydrolase-like protein [Candidatus Latescibacterota bacterium]
MDLSQIRGIIFDLDDTLFDCTGQLTDAARKRAAKVIVSEISTLNSESLVHAQETRSVTLGSAGALIDIGQTHNLPTDLIDRARAAYNIEASECISPFPDTHSTLSQLFQRGYKLALVTSGNPGRQRRKIDQLDLASYFSESNQTLLLHDDQISNDKAPFIQQAAHNLTLPPDALLAVGDKLDAEISAANSLGMLTVRIRHGRQKNRIPQTQAEHPDFEIDKLSEILMLLP